MSEKGSPKAEDSPSSPAKSGDGGSPKQAPASPKSPEGSPPAAAAQSGEASPASSSAAKLAVVFDFDQCIMKAHMWGHYHNQPLGNVKIEDGGFGDLEFFRKLILALKQKGAVLAIATFGRQDVAMKAMRHAFGEDQNLFEAANTLSPKQFGQPDGSDGLGNKNTQLNYIQKEWGVPLADTLFFDDSATNLTNAKKIGVNAVFAKPFNTNVWESNGCSDFCKERGVELEF